jgi:hypothetical protein
VPILHAAHTSLESISPNPMLDRNPFQDSSSMGGGHVFDIASSEWPQHMPKPLMAAGNVGEAAKDKRYHPGQKCPSISITECVYGRGRLGH